MHNLSAIKYDIYVIFVILIGLRYFAISVFKSAFHW